jgi:hypothetical protein
VKKTLLVVAAGLLVTAGAYADYDELVRTPSILWPQGALELEVRVAVQPPLTPATRFQAERRTEELLPTFYIEALVDLLVDSYDTLGDRLAASDTLYRALAGQAASGTHRVSSSFAKDLHTVTVLYRFPFYGDSGLIGPFVQHQQPFPIRRVLGFVPARSFTGLVIYAQGDFPAHGKDRRERVRPALLPRLFDTDMNPILSPEMVAPEYLKKWGVAGYVYSGAETELAAREERIGSNPLRTMARAVFGRNATDLLLAGDTARQLLSREANRRLLLEGRILIILDPPKR